MIALAKKVIYKHKYVQSVKSKVKLLLKKVQDFKDKFSNVINKGMPCFWDNRGNLLSQEYYQVLIVQKKSEEEKFEDLERRMKGSTIVEKLIEDFEVLTEFKLIQRELSPISFAESANLKVITR